MLRHYLLGAALITSATLLPTLASSASATVPDAATLVSASIPVDAQTEASQPSTTGSILVLTVASTHLTPHSARSTVLTCDPTGGTHPRPETSCDQLTAAGGNITAMALAAGKYCPKIFQPVTATAAGWWSGSRIDYRETFANTCLLELATGPLFQF